MTESPEARHAKLVELHAEVQRLERTLVQLSGYAVLGAAPAVSSHTAMLLGHCQGTLDALRQSVGRDIDEIARETDKVEIAPLGNVEPKQSDTAEASPAFSAFVVRGQFSQEEFAAVVALIRRIDARHPDRTYELVAVDPSSKAMEIAERVLREALPGVPGRETTFTTRRTAP